MPRYSRYEPAIGDCHSISVSQLKKRGHIKPGILVYHASFNWGWNGETVASISYQIEPLSADLKRMTLGYRHGETPVRYSLDLVAVETNLGGGKRWYFVCPKTGRRCLKLICPKGSDYFFHRTAFGLLYKCQKESKHGRLFKDKYEVFFKFEDLQDELWTKYRKRHYRGEPTPLMKKFLKCQMRMESQLQTFRQAWRKG